MFKKVLHRRLLSLMATFIVTMTISTSVLAEPLKTEKVYAIDPESDFFDFYDKNYGVLQLEVNNILSSTPDILPEDNIEFIFREEGYEYEYGIYFDRNFVVQSPADIVVTVDVKAASLTGYKLIEEGNNYIIDTKNKIEFSVDNNKYNETEWGTTIDTYVGTTITLTEEGKYYICYGGENGDNYVQIFVKVINPSKNIKDSQKLKATPISSKVIVDGNEISFDAYTIEGNNYFKLRDLATVVSETEKEFEVTWDGEKNAINLISNKTYTLLGGEMTKGDGKPKTPVLNTSIIYKDGKELKLTAYTINGSNYFKLRDIAEAFDIGVTWDSNTKTIGIDTTTGYVVD